MYLHIYNVMVTLILLGVPGALFRAFPTDNTVVRAARSNLLPLSSWCVMCMFGATHAVQVSK